MRVSDLVEAMERIAPLVYAESWDRVGLYIGRDESELRGSVMLTIDLTEQVLDEAIGAGAGAIVAYHPPIWQPLERLTGANAKQRVLLGAAEAGIAVYSPHTALDAAPGGVTDWLCEGISGGDGRIGGDYRALSPHKQLPSSQQMKIVTFVPENEIEPVRNAMASSGAGIIGAYRVCSFTTPGTGTFLGDETTNPRVGRSGQLERVEELRLEMVCSRRALPLVLEALRGFHPYEEPPVDVYELHGRPMRAVGAGRRLVLDRPASVREIGTRLKGFLDTARIRFATDDPDAPLTHVGVVPGAGASLAQDAADDGCDLFVTGEMKHHEVLEALSSGMSVLLAGHTNTERGYLPRMGEKLHEILGVKVVYSERDRDLFRVL